MPSIPTPHAASPSRPVPSGWLAPAVVLGLLLGATAVLHRVTARLEARTVEQRFTELARDRVENVEGRVEIIREDLLSVAAFFDSSRSVERDEFRLFCRGILERHRELFAISWNPRVRDAERGALEDDVRKEGIEGFQITELGRGPGPTPAGPAPERFPILYREPDSRPQDLGLDLFTDPLVRAAMAESTVAEAPVLTAPATIPPVFGPDTVLRVVMPVFVHDAPPRGAPRRAEGLQGFIIAVVHAARLLEDAVSTLVPVGIHLEIRDVTPPGDGALVARLNSRLGGADQAPSDFVLARDDALTAGGRTWRVHSVAASAFDSGQGSWGSWAVLVAGGIVSLVVAGSVRRATGRAREVQRLVELRTAELSRLTTILDATPDFVGIAGVDGRRIYLNPAGCRMLGQEPGDPRPGTEISSVYPPWAREIVFQQGIPTAIRDGVWTGETALQHSSGQEIPVSQVILSHRGPDGLVSHISTVARDMSERNRIQQETIAHYNRRLEAAVLDLRRAQDLVSTQERLRALGQMASGIAHDFNNALSPVLGFAEVLLADPRALEDRERAIGYLRTIQTSARDAASVVRRLKEFYRQQEDGEPRVPLDLNAIVKETIALTQPRWKDQALRAGARIEMRHEAGEVPPVLGTEAELREALTNLVFNAVDAMPTGGVITLSTSRDGDAGVLAVSDTGAGMTEEVRQRCLEPFFTTKGQAGTGMGLAMVFGIVHRHEGTLDVQSATGAGTTIRLRFPAAPTVQAERREKTTRFRKRRLLRVLVVDDEPMIREVVKSYLELDGHTVETACDGQEALERFLGGAWDLVLTDAAMPRMNGDELAERVKQARAEVPVIQLTGFGAPGAGREHQNPHVDLYLAKPVTLEDLRLAMRRVVGP
ncbi:MAG: CHASE domain-containing protein [Planctomycetota bacterium]